MAERCSASAAAHRSSTIYVRPANHVAARGGGQPAEWRASRQAWKSRVQEADSAEGVVLSATGAGGLAILDLHAACQWSGSRPPSCPTGVVGKSVSTSCRYAHGSTPRRWQVDVKLNS